MAAIDIPEPEFMNDEEISIFSDAVGKFYAKHAPEKRVLKWRDDGQVEREFWNEAGEEKEKESMSLKKAVMSVQGDYKDRFISVEYITKKGKQISQSIQIPMGRKIRQSIAMEKKKAALKAAREAGR